MDLDKITVVVRPRNAWEGVDLGFAMARRWFLPLWLLWLAVATPLLCVSVLLISESILYASLFIWWFKPLYEPPLLFWMSRAMFDEYPGRRDMLRRWWHIVWPQLLANLSWRRLSPNRSFYMPVAVLEGLHGKQRRARLEVLGRRQQVGVWLTFFGMAVETTLEIAFSLLIIIMIPEELRWMDVGDFMTTPGKTEELLQYAGYFLAMSLVAPFYVAGGFGLYLNRRSQLEGWDIELGFRQIMARRAGSGKRFSSAALVLLGALFLGVPQHDARAAEFDDREQARTLITEVLDDEIFGKKETQTYWKYIGSEDEKDDDSSLMTALFDWLLEFFSGFFKGFASVGEALLWAVAGLAIAAFLWWLIRNRGWLPGLKRQTKQTPQAVVTLFGLDLRPESLPDDIVAAARALLERDDARAALSLLYRGALTRFVQQNNPPIPASATEGECLERVINARSESEGEYFKTLTSAWICLAYGHLLPSRQQVESLCNNWQAGDEN